MIFLPKHSLHPTSNVTMLPLLRPHEWRPWFHSFTQSLGKESWLLSMETDKPILKFEWNFANKVCLVKAMVFPVVMYRCESWTVKKAEHRRINAFELWCWRRLLRVPWTARRSNQSILKEISPGCSLEGLMLKLKLQYFGRFMWRVDTLEKTLMLGGIGGRRRRGQQKMVGWHHQLNGHGFGWTPGVSDSQGGLACCCSWVTMSQTRLSDWAELN